MFFTSGSGWGERGGGEVVKEKGQRGVSVLVVILGGFEEINYGKGNTKVFCGMQVQ